jgi:hypothetical protein
MVIMNKNLKNQARPIIEEFATEIAKAKMEITNDKPIKFRDDMITNKIRKAYKVPIDLLRFRKDNGRIASNILTYENDKGPLNESTDYGQSILKRFLEEKDPDPTKELKNDILKNGQEDIAVITIDGFLINGNRRKMVLEHLKDKHKGDARFKYLKVVILPGLNESEPPPTNEEIEQVENRYQFQKTGKAEYYNFDMALSVKRKLDLGMDLEEILLDDANYEGLKGNDLKSKIQKFKEEYIEPLKCVDRYLEELKRPGHYNTVSEGRGDKEGRWQAFLDYYKLYKKLRNDKEKIKLNIQDGDEGKIENIAFKIIRQRHLKGIDKKAHEIIRKLPHLLGNLNAKKELFKLAKIDFSLPKEDITNEEGKEVDEKTKDTIWGNKYASDIIHHVRKAYDIFDQKKEQDTPIELLNAALDKLNHSNMDITTIDLGRIEEAMKLSREIQIRANELEHQLYDVKKSSKKLAEKFKKN